MVIKPLLLLILVGIAIAGNEKEKSEKSHGKHKGFDVHRPEELKHPNGDVDVTSGRKLGRSGKGVQHNFRKMTDVEKEAFRMRAGIKDLADRERRLRSVHQRFHDRTQITREHREHIRRRKEHFRRVKHTRLEPHTGDLFAVNHLNGLSELLFQGDIQLTDGQLEEVETRTSDDVIMRKKRQVASLYPKWPQGKVYYYFDSSINDRKKNSVRAAHDYISSRTCIDFIASATATNRIKVFSGAGCYSSIGMTGGEQVLSLGDGCEVFGTAAHEFTHSLGAWHTQMRDDRDQYITIDLDDVAPNSQGNFMKQPVNQIIDYVPYEYGSFMHYAADSFVTTEDGDTSIIPNDVDYLHTMGNRLISFYDIHMINKHYNCYDKCANATKPACKNGGEVNPRDCTKCNCPFGYSGPLCDQRPTGCGMTLVASTTWKPVKIAVGNAASSTVRDVFDTCTYWISAPSGTHIEVRATAMTNSQCNYGCTYNGIEFKTKADQRITSPRFCCSEFNDTHVSSVNPMAIIAFNRYSLSTFDVDYRYVTAKPAQNIVTQPTTTAPKTTPRPTTACADKNSEANCVGLKSQGFCTDGSHSIDTIKYNCAKTCGLCGKVKSPCADVNPRCPSFDCNSLPPLDMEYHCAKSCGFCVNPV